MEIKELIFKNRSYRRFYEQESISEETLTELVDLARLSASGRNLQPLKFMLSHDPIKNNMIFPCLSWAGYLKDWPGPEPGERPSAYIIMLGDKNISTNFGIDHGIAAQSILIGAVEKGLGGCMVVSINRNTLIQALEIPEHLELLMVIALGKPKEKVVIAKVGESGDIKFWRDAEGVHYVPKRELKDIIL